MKITKYAQSCILIKTKEKRILIDPGYLKYDEKLLIEAWANIDLVLVTHKHSDHCHEEAIKEILKNQKTKFYASREVANTYPNLQPAIIKEGDPIELDDVKIEAVKAVHGYLPGLKDGKEIHENIGFIIDDGEKRAYTTSDSICFDNNYKCDVLFVPVCNHGLVMGPFEAAEFAISTEAKFVIPVHYDNPKYPTDLDLVEEEFKKHNLNYKILEIGEGVEI